LKFNELKVFNYVYVTLFTEMEFNITVLLVQELCVP